MATAELARRIARLAARGLDAPTIAARRMKPYPTVARLMPPDQGRAAPKNTDELARVGRRPRSRAGAGERVPGVRSDSPSGPEGGSVSGGERPASETARKSRGATARPRGDVTAGRDPHPTCRWIDGDPARPGWRFCGAPAVTGVLQGDGIWCAAHWARVYEPRPARALKSPERYVQEAAFVAALPAGRA